MHVESVGASSCRVQVDMPKNTRIYFRSFSEDALTDEISSLKTTAARLKFKGIDGGLHKRWSMWFNSTQRAKPYQFPWNDMHAFGYSKRHSVAGAAWLSSARGVSCWVKS